MLETRIRRGPLNSYIIDATIDCAVPAIAVGILRTPPIDQIAVFVDFDGDLQLCKTRWSAETETDDLAACCRP